MTGAWQTDLEKHLSKDFDANKGKELAAKYSEAFHTSYMEDYTAHVAVLDIKRIEKLSPENTIGLAFYRDEAKALHLRLFQYETQMPLSDVLPMFENMDLRTMAIRPYKITLPDTSVWVSDFEVSYPHPEELNVDKVKENFQEAFIQMRLGKSENDGFNKLILNALLTSRQVTILRAYAKYLRQAGFSFSQNYIEEALVNHADVTENLITLFNALHDPKNKSEKIAAEAEAEILQELEKVTSLDEDRIIRRMLHLVKATLRTNYFQPQEDGSPKEYLSLKLDSKAVPELPLPVPMFEIFVYSPRFEAIHLRNAKVARGGIRWSDRREDFRTEVLGLMKAQKVKNAVIVPSGAKGGFVLKTISPQASRAELQQEVVYCYKSFIRGLLDLTDNLKDGKVIPPKNVVRHDEDDTYLVVAADKGTATFSDTANAISKEYDFWLGDAFASGGSVGYDHKKMGITARGAWESIKRHFHELGINYNTTDFTVIGIGDMSGDVFGNGLIYSPHTKLIGAFDHRHIFLDPNPNAETSYQERLRLFNLPTSSWEDYNPELISEGGGVYKRTNKSITLTPQVKQMLGVEVDSLVPTELIRAMLKAPVDLLFNGGIGTYVKSSTESHADVGDKTNEACRVNGSELQCCVVGEGGNLGFTQLGRVEYALEGGLINTDFIDNSAGVDCSDHEVNIKILLNEQVNKGKITEDERNKILESMTQEVSDLVLQDNFNQALVMSIATFFSPQFITLHQNYIKDMEAASIINRNVEYLPEEKRLLERKASGLGLTRPELAVLLAYTKIHLKNEILNSDIPENAYFSQILDTAFPASLKKHYAKEMANHSLHREIVATQLSNFIVNEHGITFVHNLYLEMGSSVPEIIRAAIAAIRIYGTSELQEIIQALDFKIPIATQYELLGHIRRLIYLSTRWFLRRKRLTNENMEEIINHFSKNVKELQDLIPSLMGGFTKNYLETLSEQFKQANISQDDARRIAGARAMYTSLNIIDIATQNKFDLKKTARIYFAVGEYFNLLWFRDRLASDNREGYWEALSRLTLRDQLDTLQKQITIVVMNNSKNENDTKKSIETWIEENHRSMERWEKIMEMLHSSTSLDYAMYFIALRELSDLINTGVEV